MKNKWNIWLIIFPDLQRELKKNGRLFKFPPLCTSSSAASKLHQISAPISQENSKTISQRKFNSLEGTENLEIWPTHQWMQPVRIGFSFRTFGNACWGFCDENWKGEFWFWTYSPQSFNCKMCGYISQGLKCALFEIVYINININVVFPSKHGALVWTLWTLWALIHI